MAYSPLDVTTLSQHDASEYRRELITAIYNPGTDYDLIGDGRAADEAFYRAKLAEVDAYLKTFPEQI